MASNISVGRVAENRKARHDYDIIETIELELEQIAKYHDQLEMIKTYIDPVLSPYQDKHLP